MRRIFSIVIILLAMATTVSAETVDLVFLVDAPDGETGLQIYLAGNFQGWNPGNPDFRLSDLGGGVYGINLSLENNQTLEFKFTRGVWGKVEKGLKGEEISNRVLKISQAGTHRFQVGDWADNHKAAPIVSTASGDVRLLQVPGFPGGRQVRVWLPAEYNQNPDKRYPVLYMFDGQNVFDAASSFAGEWRVDEICRLLISEGKIRPLIVVAIDHGGEDRILEYTPWNNSRYSQENGSGLYHLHLIKKHIVPYIDQEFRTLQGPQNTGLMGSSLGGLMTIFGAGYFEEIFGLFGSMSPSLWWDDYRAFSFAEESINPGIKIYIDMGGQENDVSDSMADLQKMKKVLKKRGFREGQDFLVVEDETGKHNESAWARRLPNALMFLFPPEQPTH